MKKVTALSTIILGIINFLLIIASVLVFPHQSNYETVSIIITLFTNVFNFILMGSLCAIIFSVAIIVNNEKFIKTMKIILFISLIMGCLSTIISSIITLITYSIYAVKLGENIFMMSIIKIILTAPLHIIANILVIIMVYGLYKNKKLPYLILSIVSFALITLAFLISLVTIIFNHVAMLYNLVTGINIITTYLFTCSYIATILLCGRDIIKE